jgi:hypothetical protein
MGVKFERKSVNGGIAGLKKNAKPALVKVGVLAGTGEHPNATDGQTIAEIAWWNEFGTENIPERPFLRNALRENAQTYRDMMRELIKSVLLGKINTKKAIDILGLHGQSDVRKSIVDLWDPPNSEVTIAAKGGKSNPLIDTGALRQSINWGEF